MSQTSLLFWSARFLIFGGILLVSGVNLTAGFTNDVSVFNDLFYFPSTILIALGTLLILMPFPLVYAFQAEKRGFLGFMGFILAFTGLASFGFGTFITSLIFPALAMQGPENEALINFYEIPFPHFDIFKLGSLIVLALGFCILGISGLKARIYSSAVPILFITGGITTVMIPIQPYNLQIGLSLISLGIILAGNHIYGEAKS